MEKQILAILETSSRLQAAARLQALFAGELQQTLLRINVSTKSPFVHKEVKRIAKNHHIKL